MFRVKKVSRRGLRLGNSSHPIRLIDPVIGAIILTLIINNSHQGIIPTTWRIIPINHEAIEDPMLAILLVAVVSIIILGRPVPPITSRVNRSMGVFLGGNPDEVLLEP